jgi:AraC-like DNA-binding protein
MPNDSSTPSCRPTSDALSDVLQDLRFSSVSYGVNEFTAPWGIDIPAERGARFHFVAQGHCWVRRVDRDPVRLEEGDVVLLPHGGGHTIGDTPAGATRPLRELPFERLSENAVALRTGGDGPSSLIVCGTVDFSGPMVNPLLELMPDLLLVRAREGCDPALPMLLDTMAAEIVERRVGAATVTTRLADIVIIRVIRAWFERHAREVSGWLAAIRNPRISQALAAIHRQPNAVWSVKQLAQTAGMSRSLFAERFAAIVGMPPARYVERCRLYLASDLLRAGHASVAEVSARVGYASDVSFRRALKRVLGVAPGALRQPAADHRNVVATTGPVIAPAALGGAHTRTPARDDGFSGRLPVERGAQLRGRSSA